MAPKCCGLLSHYYEKGNVFSIDLLFTTVSYYFSYFSSQQFSARCVSFGGMEVVATSLMGVQSLARPQNDIPFLHFIFL